MIERQVPYPAFVKPANGGSSVGVSKARNREELLEAVSVAGECDRKIVIEQAIEGREVECAVLGQRRPRGVAGRRDALQARVLRLRGQVPGPVDRDHRARPSCPTESRTACSDLALRAFRAIDGVGSQPGRLLPSRRRIANNRRNQYDAGVHAGQYVPSPMAGGRSKLQRTSNAPGRPGARNDTGRSVLPKGPQPPPAVRKHEAKSQKPAKALSLAHGARCYPHRLRGGSNLRRPAVAHRSGCSRCASLGTDTLDTQAVADLAGLKGQSMLRLGLGEARAKLLAIPQVKSVRFSARLAEHRHHPRRRARALGLLVGRRQGLPRRRTRASCWRRARLRRPPPASSSRTRTASWAPATAYTRTPSPWPIASSGNRPRFLGQRRQRARVPGRRRRHRRVLATACA